MSVSQGTKNLKFMQRAAARAAPSSSKPAPHDTPAAADPTSSARVVPGEESLRWTLPPPITPSTQAAVKGKGKAAIKIAYEQSYLPFLFDDEGDADREDGNAVAGPSRGGRFVFGRQEEAVVKPKQDEEVPMPETDDQPSSNRPSSRRPLLNPPRPTSTATAIPSSNPLPDSNGFLRPSGFDDLPAKPPSATTASKRKTPAQPARDTQLADKTEHDDDDDEIIQSARKKRSKKSKKDKKEQNQQNQTDGTMERQRREADDQDEDKEAIAFLEGLMNEIRDE